jgi:hypothetical protein
MYPLHPQQVHLGAKSAWLQICISGGNWSVHACTYRSCTLPLRRSHGQGGEDSLNQIFEQTPWLWPLHRGQTHYFQLHKTFSERGRTWGGGPLLPSAFIKKIYSLMPLSACAPRRFLKMVLCSSQDSVHLKRQKKICHHTEHIFHTVWLKNYGCFRQKCTQSVIVRHEYDKKNLKRGWVTDAKSVYLYYSSTSNIGVRLSTCMHCVCNSYKI